MIIVFLIVLVYLHLINGFCKHPPGKYCQWGSKYQNDCPRGSYCPKNAFGPRKCPTGTYLDTYGMSNITDCKSCISGYYCSRIGLDLPNGVCKNGYYCPTGTKSPTENICPANNYCPSNSSGPLQCKPGMYQLHMGAWFCNTCPPATILNVTTFPVNHKTDENITLTCLFNVSSFNKDAISYNLTMQIISLDVRSDILYHACIIYMNTSKIVKPIQPSVNTTGKYSYTCIINSVCGIIEKTTYFTIMKETVDEVYQGNFDILLCVIIIVIIAIVIIVIVTVVIKQRKMLNVRCYHSKHPKQEKSVANKEEISLSLSVYAPDEKVDKLSCEKKTFSQTPLTKTVTYELTDDIEFDVFICYSSIDRHWVKNTLLHNLESHGIKACIDFRDFLVGAYIVENITDAIFKSHKTIAVLSPDFLSSIYCKAELKQALSRLDEHQVIPILYRLCDVPDVLQHKTYLDWCHPDVQPHFWSLLINSIKSDRG